MLFQNEFDQREEVIFIEYERVIKNPDQYLLHRMGNDLSFVYENFMNLDEIKGIDMDNAMTASMLMKTNNIFTSFAKGQLNPMWYDDYVRLFHLADDMYQHTDLLDIGKSLYSLMYQKFVKKIYLWSPRPDERIIEDITQRHHSRAKVEYVYGDLAGVLKMIPDEVTVFAFGDVEHMNVIKDYEHIEYTEIMYAKYRFNLVKDPDDGKYKPKLDPKIFGQKPVKITEFAPTKLMTKNFTKFLKK